MLPLQCQRVFEKADAQQGRFAALPGKDDFFGFIVRNVLRYDPLQHVGRHGRRRILSEQCALVEIIAIVAGEIAGGAARFDHEVETPPLAVRPDGERRQTHGNGRAFLHESRFYSVNCFWSFSSA